MPDDTSARTAPCPGLSRRGFLGSSGALGTAALTLGGGAQAAEPPVAASARPTVTLVVNGKRRT